MQSASRGAFVWRLVAAGATDIGQRRRHNEDSILLRPDLNLFLLADGAGGHNAGNLASALATTSIANFFEAGEGARSDKIEVDDFGLWVGARRLARAVQKANGDVIEIGRTSNARKGMGSTIVAALMSPASSMLHVAHVGDSRCYRMRDGRLEQLTHDHSLINDVLELRPDMSDEAIKKLPANVVTRALGMEATVRVAVRSHVVAPRDRFLLCSDGLSGALLQRQIAELLNLPQSPAEIAQGLVDAANDAGGPDNIAVIVVFCDLGAGPSIPARPPSVAPVVAAQAMAPPPTIPPLRPLSSLTAPSSRGSGSERPAMADSESDREESLPEIVLVGIEDTDLESTGQIRIVPAESASVGMLDAIDDFVGSMRLGEGPPPELDETRANPGPIVCAACGATIDTAFCPHCGAAFGAE